MTDLPYGLSAFDRDRGNFPEVPVVNMFVEKVPTEPNPVLQSRPGLKNSGVTLGSGPVQGLFHVDGVLSGQLFAVSGSHVYVDSVDVGSISGSGPVSIDGFENRAFFCAGQDVWQYDGTSLSMIATPGSFSVLSLCVGTSRLIVIDKNTGHFYWSDVLSPSITALNFATAENSPDKLKECLFLGDTLILFGSETVEQWPASSADPNLPYTPLVGRTYQVGIRDTGCATTFQNSFAWITNQNQVAVGDPTTIISDSSVEEKISLSSNARLWTFRLEGVEFLAITLDHSTWVFNAHSSQWSTFESYGQDNWIPRCYSSGFFGSGVDGRLMQWSDDHSDFGDILERKFRAGTPISTGTMPLYNITLRTNPGQTPYITGTYADPKVSLRTSKDGGYVWSSWKEKSLGAQGNYRKPVKWTSLGFFGSPSLLVEFRVTDPVPFRISGVSINDDYAGI